MSWIPRVDPLILDLDNDGIETVGTEAGVLFDANADGIKNGTGWVSKDDGFLVWDKSGNGTIDTGRELFGDSFIKANGQTALNGFDALSSLDDNADGKVNAADAAWSSLRVWIDADTDGVTDAGELKTLAALNITAVNTSNTVVNQTLPNGNILAAYGTYVKGDGTTANAGLVYQNADIDLAQDTFNSQFTDSIPILADVASLPDMSGSGRVRDLQQAASLNSTQGQALKSAVTTFNAATTRDAQRAQLDALLLNWADTSDLKLTLQQRNPNITGVWRDPAQRAEWENKLHILEAFNGRYFFTLPGETGTASSAGALAGLSLSSPDASGRQVGTITLAAPQVNALQQSFDALRESVYQSLVLQTRLKPWLDSVQFQVSESEIRFDMSILNAQIDGRLSTHLVNGLTDLIELGKYAQPMLANTGFDVWSKLENILRSTEITPAISNLLSQFNIQLLGADNDTVVGTSSNDVLYGGLGNDNLQAGSGNDTLSGGKGNDEVQGGIGNNTYLFGKGDGQDSIRSEHDATPGKLSTLQFKAGVLPTEVTLSTAGNRLLIQINGTSDQVLVENFLYEDNTANPYNPSHYTQLAAQHDLARREGTLGG